MSGIKDSGIYWLGEVPSDWDLVPAWRVMRERSERSMPDDEHLTPSQTYGVITQQEYMSITGNKVVLNLTGADKMKRVRPGDFIIHLRSFQGGIEASSIGGKVSNAYTVLTPSPDAHFGYYRWFMKSVPLIEGLASSTDQLRDGQSINFSRFSRLTLPLPPLETQQRIAAYLDRETAEIDATVANLDKYVELLEKRRDLIIAKAAVGRYSPLWNHVHVQNGYAFSTDEFSDSGDIPLVRIRDIRGKTFETYISRDAVPSDDFIIQDGDLVVGMDGDFNSVIWNRGEAALNQRVCVIRPDEVTDIRYVNYAMRGPLKVVNDLRYSTTVKHLSQDDIYSMRIPLPSLEEQRRIADHLDRETADINFLISESTKLRDLLLKRRSVLITDVVTGRKQV